MSTLLTIIQNEQNTSSTQNENTITSEEIEAFLDKIHLEDMNINDVKNLYKTVKNIYDMGRREFVIWREKRDQRRAGYAKSMSDILEATTKKPDSKVIKSAQDLSKNFRLDIVGKLGVVFWNAIQTPGRFLASLGEPFRRLFEDEFTTRRGEAEQQKYLREKSMNEALQKLGLSIQHFMNDAFTLDGETYTWSHVMGIYLGMKNEKSRKAILWGNFVKTLANPNNKYASEEEGTAAINKILEFINQHPDYKAAADLIIQDTDLHFDRINRARIEAFNKGMNKEENYTAMHRLKHQSSAGLIDDDTESLAQSDNAQALLQKVENNFTISRQEISEQNQQPIDLNVWKNWQTTVTNEEYMAALGGYAADLTSALLLRGKNGSIQELIKSRLGNSHWNTLKSIFNDSITNRDILEQNGLIDIQSMATYFIKARSVAYVAFSPLSMLTQTSSYFLGLGNDYSSRSHLLRSLADFVIMGQQGRGRDFLERVYKLSPELRFTGGDPVERAIQNQWQYSNEAARFVSQYGYKGVQVLDNWTKCIVFDTVYQSKLENGFSEEDAIRLANRAVHDTQPASTLREMPRMLRVGGWTKLCLTQFMNALAPIMNMAIVDVARNLAHPSWNTVKATAWNMLAVGLTISWVGFLKDAFNGRLPTGNELANGEVDDWGKWLFDTNIENLINSIPVFNHLVTAWRMWSGKQAYRVDDRISEPFNSLARAGKYAGEDNYRAFEEFLKGAALIGVPIPFSAIKQFMRFIGLGRQED